LSVKYSPSENAIIPKTKFAIRSEMLIILSGTMSKICGPIMIPRMRYVVTAGKLIFRNSFEPRYPARMMRAKPSILFS